MHRFLAVVGAVLLSCTPDKPPEKSPKTSKTPPNSVEEEPGPDPEAAAKFVKEVDGKLRELCFAMPEVSERLSHGSPSFFIREKRALCSFHPGGHHAEGFTSLWVPAPPGVQE